MFNTIAETLKMDTAKDVVYDAIIEAFQRTPVSFLTFLTKENSPSSIRDRVFMECLQNFVLRVYQYDSNKKKFVDHNITALSVVLAKASPNYNSGYEGDPKRLREYAVRIVKMIDDCGTIQKSEYLANLTRSIINGLIDTNQYFKLCRCILSLTEEDLIFLQRDIKDKIINNDEEYIDDFRSLGILYEVNGGFAYSKRAYDLKQYALSFNHDEHVDRPAAYQERVKPISIEIADDKDIDNALFEDKQ